MLLKIIGMAIVFAVCTTAGLIKSNALSRRVRQLEALKGALNLIATEIRYFASPVDVLMHKLGQLEEYKELRIFGLCEERLINMRNFNLAWANAIEEARPALALNKGDIETMLWFGSVLGTTDIDGQIANCERYSEMLTNRLENAREDKIKRGRMYSSLGVLAGVFCVVLFI